MRPILTKPFLWVDKQSMDEFFELDPINEDLYAIYQKLSEKPFSVKIDAVRVFNEVYYQTTRMFYENPMPSDFFNYVSDIKSNLGWNYSAELVVTMSYFLITWIDGQNRRLNNYFVYYLKMNYSDCTYWNPIKYSIVRLKRQKKRVTYDFTPKPLPVKYLRLGYQDWKNITNDFDENAVKRVVYLWDKEDDRKVVANQIEEAWKDNNRKIDSIGIGLRWIANRPTEDDRLQSFFWQYHEDYQESETGALKCCEPSLSYEEQMLQEKIDNMEKEKVALKQHIAELEAENKRLNALLEKKKSNGTARKFTLVEIVGYCKGCVTWDDAKSVVAMLNKLLRQKATEEDSEMVDSIETEFKNREHGNIYNAPVGVVANKINKLENYDYGQGEEE